MEIALKQRHTRRGMMPVTLLLAALGSDLACVDTDSGSDGGGGGGGGFSTSFEAVVGRDTTVGVLKFTVATTDFSPPAGTGPTAALVVRSSAVGTYKESGLSHSLTGAWDDNLNTLSLSGSGITVTGGYNVPSGYVAGQLTDASGGPHDWQGLQSHGLIQTYCGTWAHGGTVRIAMVIEDGNVRGVGTGGVNFVGTLAGGGIVFGDSANPIGTASLTLGTVTGTLSGGALSATTC